MDREPAAGDKNAAPSCGIGRSGSAPDLGVAPAVSGEVARPPE